MRQPQAFTANASLGEPAAFVALPLLRPVRTAGTQAEAYKWALLSASSDDERGEKIRTYCEENLQNDDLDEGRLRAEAFLQSRAEPSSP